MISEITTLYDTHKPYARFYYDDGSGVIVQIHTRPISGLTFGRVGWRITAAESDSSGAALVDSSGVARVLRSPDGAPFALEIIVQSDSPLNMLSMRAEIDAARIKLARQVLAASALEEERNGYF